MAVVYNTHTFQRARQPPSQPLLMRNKTPEEQALSDLVIQALNLEEAGVDDIDPDAPLFGPDSPMGLDSVDALELALAISEQYGFEMRSDDDNNAKIFASLAALSAHVQANKTTG